MRRWSYAALRQQSLASISKEITMSTQRHIDALHLLLGGANLKEILAITDAVGFLCEGDLGSSLVALNKLDLWLKQDSEWHNKVREIYNEIRADLINNFK